MKSGMHIQDENINIQIFYDVSAYLIWGFLPIYWKLLEPVSAEVVLAHRIIWSFIFMIVFIVITKQLRSFLKECKKILHHKKTLLIIVSASFIISSNWLIFI